MIIRPFVICALPSLCLSFMLTSASWAIETPTGRDAKVWSILDNGQRREFQVSLTELGHRAPGSGLQVEAIPAVTSTDELAKAARSRGAKQADTKFSLILREKGAGEDSSSRRWLTSLITVTLDGVGADPASLAKLIGGLVKDQPAYAPQLLVLEVPAGDLLAPLKAVDLLRLQPGVLSAEVQLARQQAKRYIPNDPLFAYNANLEGYQWHLNNTGQLGGVAGVDARVTSVWDSWNGSGIKIGIVDDGMQTNHPDLSANADTAIDYDWNGVDNDPSPAADDHHGTACAGVAAARWDNNNGGTGAAPRAGLVGLRLIAAAVGDSEEAGAEAHRNDVIQIKSNSWGADDDGKDVSAPGVLTAAAIANAVVTGRGNRGTIFTWSAGNGRHQNDDANYDGYTNLNEVIAVTAVGDGGRFGAYAERGSNSLIAAPSDGQRQGITCTDLTGANGYNDGSFVENYSDPDHTNDFGGTSSACPLVSGVVALLLQSSPNLGWRDVQSILVRTARSTDPASPNWFKNAGGLRFNEDYGAGIIDAQAAVNLAANWVNLPATRTQTVASGSLNLAIPDDASSAGIGHTFVLPAGTAVSVERVRVTVAISHSSRGDLELLLTSPSGTQVILGHTRSADTAGNLNFTFGTPHFWGEPSTGNWRLQIVDNIDQDAGTLSSASIAVTGTPLGAATAPLVTGKDNLTLRAGVSFSQQLTGSWQPTSYDAVGALPAGVTLSPTGLLGGTIATAGTHVINVSARNAQGTGPSRSFTLRVIANDANLANGIDATARLTVSPGHTSDGAWTRQTTTTHDGSDALRSAVIGANQRTAFEARVTGPGLVSFWWKVSSLADKHKLRVAVQEREILSISGEVAWEQASVAIPAGQQSIRWLYTKSDDTPSGTDAGWVDQVVFTSYDADADGFTTQQEAKFGTSDTNANAYPRLTIQRGAGRLLNFTFPSVSGNRYKLQSSLDLLTWSDLAAINASAASTATANTPTVGISRLFYRVISN